MPPAPPIPHAPPATCAAAPVLPGGRACPWPAPVACATLALPVRLLPQRASRHARCAAASAAAAAWREGAGCGRVTHPALRDALRLARHGERLSLTTVLGLAWHPDERVPIALAHNPRWRVAARAGSAARAQAAAVTLCALAHRALNDLAQEGALWTPVLDALVAADRAWPGVEAFDAYLETAAGQGALRLTGHAPAYRSVLQLRERVRRWAGTLDAQEGVVAGRAFLAAQSAVPVEDLLAGASVALAGVLGAAVARFPHWVLTGARRASRTTPASAEVTAVAAGLVLDALRGGRRQAWDAATAYTMVRRGAWLAQWAPPPLATAQQAQLLATGTHGRRARTGAARWRARLALALLDGRAGQLGTSVLLARLALADVEPVHPAVAIAPGATPVVWRGMVALATRRGAAERAALATTLAGHGAMQDPVVRHFLVGQPAAFQVPGFLESLDDGDLAGAVRRLPLDQLAPVLAAAIARVDAVAPHLRPLDLLRLCAAPNGDVREAALLLAQAVGVPPRGPNEVVAP